MDNFWDWVGYLGHSLSGTAIVGTLLGWFPPVAAVAAFVFYTIQIYESRTIQRAIARHRALKIARLKARIQVIEEKVNYETAGLKDEHVGTP